MGRSEVESISTTNRTYQGLGFQSNSVPSTPKLNEKDYMKKKLAEYERYERQGQTKKYDKKYLKWLRKNVQKKAPAKAGNQR